MTRSPLLRSPELRIVAAAAVAAVSLGLALLEGVAARTDLLMLDFREWQAVGPRPDSAAYFDTVQTVPPDLRPLKLDLRLAEPGSASDFLAVEHRYEVEGDGCYRFRAYARSVTPVETARAFLFVNDEAVWSLPLAALPKSLGISVDGLRPRQGEIEVRLELRAEPRGALPGAAPPPAVVRFEYPVLRSIPCNGPEGAGA